MTTATVDPALERNRAFAAAGGHQGAVLFPNLRLFVITCLDPRVDPRTSSASASATRWSSGTLAGGSPGGDHDVAFIGQLAENMVPDGPLFEVAVIHHTQCANRRAR